MVASFARAAVAATALLATSVSAIDPIQMKGAKFFYENGTQFFMKGVAYQQEAGVGPGGDTSSGGSKYVDPLADAEACKRDVPLLAALQTNTIRTYAIDPTKDHKACMNLLEKHGIYVIADLGEPSTSIDRNNPEWNVELFQRYKDVIDELGNYDNVIGFFSGNEVTNNRKNTDASAFVKAATRDTKAYIKTKMDNGHRWMGVGYAANDDADIRVDIAQYFNCGPTEDAIDYWGYNIYSWCGESSYTKSGYDVQVDFFKNYSVPVFFAEYGCNAPGGAEGRKFDDTVALYSDKMTDVFSGGIVYMYHQEENDYGLVKIKNGNAQTMKNYDALEKQMKKVDPTAVQMDSYQPSNEPAACPSVSKNWKVSGELPPTPDADLCKCMTQSASCSVADKVSPKQYGKLFGQICGESPEACAGIKTEAETGVYGPYSMCNAKDKLTHVLDAYYKGPGNEAADACSWNGMAEKVSNPSPAGTCTAKLASASKDVQFAATASSAPLGSNGGSGGSGDDDEGAGISMRPFAMGAYVVLAMGAGAAALLI